jgi:cadmium resistance protein CadD (predicted permease)
MKIQFVKEEITNDNIMPSWKHRRRLIYIGFFIGVGMIVFAGLTFFTDTGVSNQMVVGGVSLISIILTSYTAMATYEDVKLWKQQQTYENEEYEDLHI